MLSIQQLIKVLRKLQSGSNTSALDLAKYLKNASSSTTATTTPALATTTIQQAIVTSLLAQQESNKSELGAVQSPKQQTENEYESETTANDSSQNNSQTAPSATLSHILHSNTNGVTQLKNQTCAPSPTFSSKSKQQSQQQNLKDFAVCRSQQIQTFYQQQLLHFHTQQSSNLQAKQKQTQFSMSSLAAAIEPVALKEQQQTQHQQEHDEAAATTNGVPGTTEITNGTSCHDGKTTAQGTAPTGKPCFNTGLAEILKFMELIGNLKHTKRTGWVLRDVNDCESISGHMYRMSMMTFLLDGTEGLNQIRCMELALVHDLAESLVGDITPFCGVSKADKREMEFKAMDDICKLIEPRGKRIMELFEEYEHGKSPESKFVKDLDRLDMVMQAFEYEKRDNCLLKHQEFFDSTEGKFNHPFVKKLVDEICAQRRDLAKIKGATPPPSIHVPDMEADDIPTASRNGHCVTQEKQQTNSNSS